MSSVKATAAKKVDAKLGDALAQLKRGRTTQKGILHNRRLDEAVAQKARDADINAWGKKVGGYLTDTSNKVNSDFNKTLATTNAASNALQGTMQQDTANTENAANSEQNRLGLGSVGLDGLRDNATFAQNMAKQRTDYFSQNLKQDQGYSQNNGKQMQTMNTGTVDWGIDNSQTASDELNQKIDVQWRDFKANYQNDVENVKAKRKQMMKDAMAVESAKRARAAQQRAYQRRQYQQRQYARRSFTPYARKSYGTRSAPKKTYNNMSRQQTIGAKKRLKLVNLVGGLTPKSQKKSYNSQAAAKRVTQQALKFSRFF